MIDRDVETSRGWVRVSIESDDDIRDPRDYWEGATDDDIRAWYREAWEFVTVVVQELHSCAKCQSLHVGNAVDSLGLVAFGTGDGWSVTLDDLIDVHPVPDMLDNIYPKGK